MATITTRVQGTGAKGSPLTNVEVDNNFINLNTAKYESGDSASFSGLTLSSTGGTKLLVENTDTNWAGLELKAGGNQANYIFFKDDTAERVRFTAFDSGQFTISNGSTPVERLKISSAGSFVFNEGSHDVDFRVESDTNTHALFVQGSDGNVGIGTSSPVGKLELNNGTSAVELQFKETSTAYHRMGIKKLGSQLQIGEFNNDGTALTNILAIDGNGDKVGIGTSSPSFRLSLNGGMRIENLSTSPDSGSGTEYGYNTSANEGFQITRTKGVGTSTYRPFIHRAESISFDTGTTSTAERMSIHSDGNITLAGSTKRSWFTGTHSHTALQLSSWSSISGRTNDIDLAVNNNCYTSSYNVWTKPSRWQSSQMFMVNNADIIFRKSPTFTQEDFDADPTITWEGTLSLYEGSSGAVFNESSLDRDFRVESNTNTHALFVQGSDGNVGINESNPQSKLHISGTTNAGGIFVEDSSTSNSAPAIIVTGKRSDANASQSFSGKLLLSKNYTTAAHTGNGSALGSIMFGGNHTDGSASNILYAASISGISDGAFNSSTDMPTGIAFYTGSTGQDGDTPNVFSGSEAMRIASSGNVGIGRTNPYCALDVQKDVGTGGVVARFGNSNATYTQTVSLSFDSAKNTILDSGSSTGGFIWEGGTNGYVFNESSLDRDFRVESDGNSHALFVDASRNGVFFHKSNADDTIGGINFEPPGSAEAYAFTHTEGADNSGWSVMINRQNSIGNVLAFRQANQQNGSVYINGTGVVYNTTSDRRLKDNIETITDGTDKLMAMNPVTHTWKADPDAPAVHGFIAQEMQDVVPEAVVGEDGGDEMMSMDYGRITPVIVAALQDAHREIQNLKAEIAALKGDK